IANCDGSPIVTVEAPLDAFRAVWKLNAIVAGFCPACDGAAFVAIQTTTPSEAVLSENAHYLAPVLLLVMFHWLQTQETSDRRLGPVANFFGSMLLSVFD